MHYKNGREAKNGDKVVMITAVEWHPTTGQPTKFSVGPAGILYDAKPGQDYCNGKLAITSPTDPVTNLKECLHVDDVVAALPAEVPDTSKVG